MLTVLYEEEDIEEVPLGKLISVQGRTIRGILAEGDSLEWIKNNFTGIPIFNKPYSAWNGDLAVTIVMNWNLEVLSKAK